MVSPYLPGEKTGHDVSAACLAEACEACARWAPRVGPIGPIAADSARGADGEGSAALSCTHSGRHSDLSYEEFVSVGKYTIKSCHSDEFV